MIEIRLLNASKKLSNTFNYDEGFIIEIEYRTHQKLIGLSLGIIIFAENGEAVFTTASRSAKNNRELNIGAGISRVKIPGFFLSPGEYSVFLNAHSLHDVFWEAHNILSFNILDVGREILGREGQMRWPGYISPLLEWKNLHKKENGDDYA